MPETNFQLVLFVMSVGLFTATAAVTDFRWHRIPNRLTVPVFLLGLLYQAVFNGWAGPEHAGVAEAGLKSALLGFAIGFGPLLVLWLIGGGGGGDVKLMGALSVWLGFELTLLVLVVSTAFVLIGTLAVISWSTVSHGPFQTKSKYVAGKGSGSETVESRRKRRIMAYAIPVALATWAVLIWQIPRF
jgi:prepilin peptidase CpaA